LLKNLRLKIFGCIVIMGVLFLYITPVSSLESKIFQIEEDKEYISTTEVTLEFNIEYLDKNNIEYVKIGNNKDNFTSWKSFSETKEWQLRDRDGERTVYVKFKDNQDNISDIYKDSIFLEITSPKIDMEYKRAIIDLPDYDKEVKAEVDSTTEVEKVIFTLTSEDKEEKIEVETPPYKIEVSPGVIHGLP